jgi:hypothetical protein
MTHGDSMPLPLLYNVVWPMTHGTSSPLCHPWPMGKMSLNHVPYHTMDWWLQGSQPRELQVPHQQVCLEGDQRLWSHCKFGNSFKFWTTYPKHLQKGVLHDSQYVVLLDPVSYTSPIMGFVQRPRMLRSLHWSCPPLQPLFATRNSTADVKTIRSGFINWVSQYSQ